MNRSLRKARAEAQRLFLTGELTSNVQIASLLQVKAHTVGRWRRMEDWDGMRQQLDRRAGEMLTEKLASDRTVLNSQHFQLWNLLLGRVLASVKSDEGHEAIAKYHRIAGIIDKAQRGQRLARGLASDSKTEEQILAETQVEIARMIDQVLTVVQENVHDEQTLNRIHQGILSATAPEENPGAGQSSSS